MPHSNTNPKLYFIGLILLFLGIVMPFVFLKDYYPFHRFGMFAEPIKHHVQEERFYVFYQYQGSDWTLLRPNAIPINANAFVMQQRRHHYKHSHEQFVTAFAPLIKSQTLQKQLNWKWFHVQGKDSLCVYSSSH